MSRCQLIYFLFSSRRRHTRFDCDWSSDVCSSDLEAPEARDREAHRQTRTASKVTGASNGQGGPDRSTFHIDETLLAAKPHSGGDRDEIGRASCRERG